MEKQHAEKLCSCSNYCLFMAITNTSAKVKQGSTTLMIILHKHFMMIFVHTFASVIQPPGSLPPAAPLVKEKIE